ncbi:twin-arginine translocase TatA/TatE family subunit [Dehalobacter sp. DCM]|uniref:twin-arginine translocase TatA/TatE family subunit n=1 Tax=Dehalobacter sp. DCM TaxID=2907827 RepID=UPI003FCECB4C|nr:twin-arginine translocase TatA/TatE family subunit [Dehalobacter sp. DCM]
MVTFGIVTPTVAVILLVLALIVIGPGKLPEAGKSLGRGLKEFKQATNEVEDTVSSTTESIKENLPKTGL